MLNKNLVEVEKNIAAACKRAGRSAEEVTLIAVSKTKPVSDILEIYKEGQRAFGENKVQEMLKKQAASPGDIKWHLIGHLQTNKVKSIIGKTELVHSVDSQRLAETISKEALKQGAVVNCLIEVNVAQEESKFGVSVDETLPLIRAAANLPGLRICGLMTIAPFVENPEENRAVFRQLRQLSVDIAGQNIDNVSMKVLSMGMTNDYIVAVEEGSTHVRVGTAIFGERMYSI